MNYLHFDETTITDFSDSNIGEMYEKGYVFTRIGRGVMHQTRSIRIDLNKFDLTSENRRILRKVNDLKIKEVPLPLKEYNYTIGKLAKDFYEKKFGPGIMSAQKVKEMLTDSDKSNFNVLLEYSLGLEISKDGPIAYSICYSNDKLIHYSYPFYDLNCSLKDIGLGMMTKAILGAKEAGMEYIYLGSLQRRTDTYKLQFEGLEWFDGKKWSRDLETVKSIMIKK